jgi:hypothetical protein
MSNWSMTNIAKFLMPCCYPDNDDKNDFSLSENNKKPNKFDQNNYISKLNQEYEERSYENESISDRSANTKKRFIKSKSSEKNHVSISKSEYQRNSASHGLNYPSQPQAKIPCNMETILIEDYEDDVKISENQKFDSHSLKPENAHQHQYRGSFFVIAQDENFHSRQKQENSHTHKQIKKFKSSNGSTLRKNEIDELSERFSTGRSKHKFQSQIIKKSSLSQQDIESHNNKNLIKERVSISQKYASHQSLDGALRRSSNSMKGLAIHSFQSENLKVNKGQIDQIPVLLSDDKHLVELKNSSSQISNTKNKEFNDSESMRIENLIDPNINATSNKKDGLLSKFFSFCKSTVNGIDTIGYNMTNANIATYGNKKRGS